MQIYKCDRCAEIITDSSTMKPLGKYVEPNEYGESPNANMFYGSFGFQKMDLCPTCYQEFCDWWDERVNDEGDN